METKPLSKKMQHRVDVMRDIQMLVKQGRLHPIEGSYIHVEGDYGHYSEEVTWSGVCEAFKQYRRCQVCMDGAVMMSFFHRKGSLDTCDVVPRNLKGKVIDSKDGVHSAVKSIFSIAELDILEAAYETNEDLGFYSSVYDRRNACCWGRRINDGNADETERMLAIAQSIIDHDGRIVFHIPGAPLPTVVP